MTIPSDPIGNVPVNTGELRSLAPHGPVYSSTVRDLVALTKPRITLIVVATGLGGVWGANRFAHAKGLPEVSSSLVTLSLLATVLVVSGANALNMYLERDTDV